MVIKPRRTLCGRASLQTLQVLNVDTLDSEESGPTAGVAGSSLSSTAGTGRLAAPLRGKHSRREDGRLDRLSRLDRLHLEGAFACISLKLHALLEQMIVEGTLCSKPSCVVLVEASRVPGEGDEAAGRKAEEALSDVCMKCAKA